MLWGGDARPMYERLESLKALEPGATVIDAACGAGLALRWLDPARECRYLGVDCSPAMLARARERARRRGFVNAELQLGDVASVPSEDASAGAYLLYNMLHVVTEPERALAEALRCLEPGGRLEGSVLLRGEVPRVDRFFERERRKPTGLLGPGGTREDLLRWLEPFDDPELEGDGSLATIRARRPLSCVLGG